jgi:putative addiction module killer protein
MIEVLFYQAADGHQPFDEWMESLKDARVRTRIKTRIDRLFFGNFGDTKLVGTGIWELRFHFGPGYRVYFGLDGAMFVILLCGGDKSTQDKDIQTACLYWQDYLRRKQ